MKKWQVPWLVLWCVMCHGGCHAWMGATDGYVSRSMPVPENPDYSEQLYSVDSFQPEPFISDSETWCRSNLPGLPKVSRLMCETFPRSTVLMAYQGTRAGIHNCREAFANERWRCEGLSVYAESTGLLSLFDESSNPIMATHSREQALVEAFVGAGAAVTVARACGDGYLSTECSCGDSSPNSDSVPSQSSDQASSGGGPNGYVATNVHFGPADAQSGSSPRQQGGLLLEGCNHNFKVGYNLAREFLTTLFKSLAKKKKHAFALTRHNMALGVVTAMEKHQKKCACHGESGTCSLKTCWVQPRDMKTIAAALKEKKDYSQQVEVTSERTLLKAPVRDNPLYLSPSSMGAAKGGENRQRVAVPSLQDSQFGTWYPVHTNKSYNYCYPNPITQGMEGRECPAWKSASMCDVHCCLSPSALSSGSHTPGSMIEIREVQLQYDCDCKFSFCCSVKCQVCHRNQTQRVCKAPQPTSPFRQVKLA